MINGKESIETSNENAKINDVQDNIIENNISPIKSTHVSQEIANCDEIRNIETESPQINGVIGLGNSDEYLVKYPMKVIKPKLTNLEQKNNRKRSWRAVSKTESPGLFPKRFLKKHEKIRINRRSSTRLQGQASPLYFPIFRLRSKDSNLSVNDLDTTGLNLTANIEKKKRGRPKRILSIEKPLETPNITENKPESEIPVNTDISLKEKENDVKVKKIKIRKPKVCNKEVTNQNKEVTNQNKIESTTENKIPDSQPPADPATAAELKKKRPWNIPRNKLPSFTIVNNPMAFKTGEVYQSKVMQIMFLIISHNISKITKYTFFHITYFQWYLYMCVISMGNNICTTPQYQYTYCSSEKGPIIAMNIFYIFNSVIGACWKTCAKQCQVSFKNIFILISIIFFVFPVYRCMRVEFAVSFSLES